MVSTEYGTMSDFYFLLLDSLRFINFYIVL